MLKKILANKKVLISLVVITFLLIGIATVIMVTQKNKEGEMSNNNIEMEDDEKEDDNKSEDDVYNGNGLDVQDVVDEKVDSVDGSGDWDGTSAQDDDKKKPSNQKDTTQSDDTKQEESNDKNDEADGKLDKDILEDDKEWTEPN